jgi:hypothetical protein
VIRDASKESINQALSEAAEADLTPVGKTPVARPAPRVATPVDEEFAWLLKTLIDSGHREHAEFVCRNAEIAKRRSRCSPS